jgi:cytochrome c biogenesis protein
MKLKASKKYFTIFISLKFAIFLLIIIALASSLGSFIEQDQSVFFYQENYSSSKKIYGFIDSNLILDFGLNHVYTTWWFLFLLLLLGICLISCTMARQFPLLENSKNFSFKIKEKSFTELPFFVTIKNIYYLKEAIISKLQKLYFYVFQKKELVYAYKGLLGRISPILVHLSLILILSGASFGAFENFKSQEIIAKGDVFHIQNLVKIGNITSLPSLNIRINDFWIEYKKNKIFQFYSNLSILNVKGEEVENKTISVNNPYRYKGIDIYQSDWDLIGIRVQKNTETNYYEYPLFKLKENKKAWITWIEYKTKRYTIVFDQLQNNALIYNEKGEYVKNVSINDKIEKDISIVEILPATGLLIKYDPSIPFIYLGFAGLMITTSLSYLPYSQIWILNNKKYSWIGAKTNRGKIQLEIEFENFIRDIEKIIKKNKLKV